MSIQTAGGVTYVTLWRTYFVQTGALPTQSSYAVTISGSAQGYQASHNYFGFKADAPYTDVYIHYESSADLVRDGQYHAVSFSCSGGWSTNTYSWAWSGFINLPVSGGEGVMWSGVPDTEELPEPVSVEISGSDNVSVGQSYTYDATITPGSGPYTVQFSRSSTAHPADDLVYAVQEGSSVAWEQVMTFPSVDDAYEVSVTVTDAESTSDTDTMIVNASAGKPVLYGQVVVGLSNMVEFGMFTTDPGASALPWSEAIGTVDYVVTSPGWVLKGTGWYLLDVGLPAADPLKVYVTYTSPSNGLDWSYIFSFDTGAMAETGDWADSAGGSGSGEDVVPTWLEALAEKIKVSLEKLLRFLFIPTAAQMATLLPSGSLGASLLDGTTWGAVATSWTLHGHWDGHEVPLISVDLDGMSSNGFVVAVRYVMQALCTMALIYLVVVLI
jgi:hypothetical protein